MGWSYYGEGLLPKGLPHLVIYDLLVMGDIPGTESGSCASFKKNQISPSFIPKRPITLGHKFYLVHLLGDVATTSLVWIADRLSVLKRR